MGPVELADTSAWASRGKDATTSAEFEARLVEGTIATTPPVVAELLWTARTAIEFAEMRERFDALPQLGLRSAAWRRAFDVWESLARRGWHRQVSAPDLLVAAVAELAEVPVLHYDRHFELIAEVTGQPLRALAPLGSLG